MSKSNQKAAKNRVWAVSFGKTNSIVAAPTKKAAAEAFGLSLHTFNAYAVETGNDAEVVQAMTEPGQVFAQSNRFYNAPWERAERHNV